MKVSKDTLLYFVTLQFVSVSPSELHGLPILFMLTINP